MSGVPAAAEPSQIVRRTTFAPIPPEAAMRLPAKLQWALVARYRADGEYAAAAELLDTIQNRSGENATVLDERARLAFASGDEGEAIALLERRVALAPAATAQASLARLYLEVGDLERAQEIAQKLTRSDGGLQTVAALTAEVARAAGDPEPARKLHLRTLEERPGNAGALLALAGLDYEAGDAKGARAHLDLALDALAEGATTGQLTTAAALAAELGDAALVARLRDQAATLDANRIAAFRSQIQEILGTSDGDDGHLAAQIQPARPQPSPSRPATPPAQSASRRSQPTAAMLVSADTEVVEETASPEPDLEARFPGTLAELRRLFGFGSLRPGQAAVIANVLAGQDTLATMPTGAGKSLTFQLPAMLKDGITLVISPLIALMKDQVEGLPAAVRERTALVNSTLSQDEMRRALAAIANGELKLVYAAPERLRQHAFLRALRTAGVSLVVIDEAHCISLWGHDFRPDYLSIPRSLPELSEPPVLAITATATPAMAKQIGAGLGRELARVRVSLFRSNLFYEAHHCANREDKVRRLVELCHEQRRNGMGCGIVYVTSRKDAEQIAGLLRDRGIGALPYHAGLDPDTRSANQERFMAGEPRAQVMVATVAFGMGVNKADVRFIVHLSPARSLEAYAQESGRAGRDGLPARCVLYYSATDQASLNRQAARDALEINDLRKVYAHIKRVAQDRWAILDATDLIPAPNPDDDPDDAIDTRVAIGVLEQGGLILRHPDTPISRSLRQAFQTGLEQPLAPLAREDAADWNRFKSWLFHGQPEDEGLFFRTAAACAALDLTPTDIERLLEGQDEFRYRDDRRAVCLELLPAGDDAGERLRDVLERARIEANRRISQMMAYANGGRCRHAVLAAHLGERLAPCGTACDVCAGEAGQAAETVTYRTLTTAADARAILQAVRTLPYPMGKTGLTKLLAGSVESRAREDRSTSFGALRDLSRGRIDSLIDKLVTEGFLHRDMEHEYKLIHLTQQGRDATDEDLAIFEVAPAASGRRLAERAKTSEEEPEFQLDPDGEELLGRLQEWRRQRANLDAMPPYVIAHNKDLIALAVVRPTTLDALAQVPGFGPSRVAKYGQDLIDLIQVGGGG